MVPAAAEPHGDEGNLLARWCSREPGCRCALRPQRVPTTAALRRQCPAHTAARGAAWVWAHGGGASTVKTERLSSWISWVVFQNKSVHQLQVEYSREQRGWWSIWKCKMWATYCIILLFNFGYLTIGLLTTDIRHDLKPKCIDYVQYCFCSGHLDR